jgi:hypothetical protein
MIRPLTSLRAFRSALVAAAMVALPLAPGCSCGIWGALARLDQPPPTPTVDPLPSITSDPNLNVSGTSVENTAVDIEVVGRGRFRLREFTEETTYAGSITLVEGENELFVAAINGNEKPSLPAGPFVVILDTIAPGAPGFVDAPASITVGQNGVPHETVVSVSADADCATLVVTVNGDDIPNTAITRDAGGYLVAVDLNAGDNVITASCVDAAGNGSDATSVAITLVIDTTPPDVPVVNPYPVPLVFEAPETTATHTLTGTKPEGTRLVVDGVVDTEQGTGATWAVEVTLEEGNHSIALATENQFETRSADVVVDLPVRERPQTPLPDEIAAVTNQAVFTITGTRCDLGARIYAAASLDSDGATFGICESNIVGGEELGRFFVSVPLQEGDNFVYLYAERELAVQSRRVGPLGIVLDTIAPVPPVITFPSCAATGTRTCTAIVGAGEPSTAFTLSGTKEQDAALVVNGTRNDGPAGAAWATVATVPGGAVNTILTLTAVDDAGNVSEPLVVTIAPLAGLASPTFQCLGPYRITGNLTACPVALGFPEARRALRAADVATVRGQVAAVGQSARICAVPAARGLVEDPCAPGNGTVVVCRPANDPLLEPGGCVIGGNRSFTVEVPGSVLTAGTNFFLQSFTAASVSPVLGPHLIRRDDTPPATPSGLLVSDADGRLSGTPLTTRLLNVELQGVKAIDGDICVRQALVSDSCPSGVCEFSACALLTGADGLTSWSGSIRLQGGLNRLCAQSSDVVPRDGEASAAAPSRQFVGNVAPEACVDVSVATDPVPVFVAPVDRGLVRTGRFIAKVRVDDPLDLTTGVDVCVNGDCVIATEDVQNRDWDAEVVVPDGAFGDAVVFVARAIVENVVRGETTVTARLVTGSQLVSDTGPIVPTVTFGRFAPSVAGGLEGEVIAVWTDDCRGRNIPNTVDVDEDGRLGEACVPGCAAGKACLDGTCVDRCSIRDTVNVNRESEPSDVYLRRLVAGTWQRVVNVSDDSRAADSTDPVVAVDVAGVAHIAWIDRGFDDEQGALVHRTMSADTDALVFPAGDACNTDDDCPPGSECQIDSRTCAATVIVGEDFNFVGCVNDTQCATGEFCSPAGECGTRCPNGESDCLSNEDCINGFCSGINNDLLEKDFRPSIATGPGGETAMAWVKQRDPVENAEDTRYVTFAVYCSTECGAYLSEAQRQPRQWSSPVQISPRGFDTPLDFPAIALEADVLPDRKAWVAWNLCNGTADACFPEDGSPSAPFLIQLRDVPLDPNPAPNSCNDEVLVCDNDDRDADSTDPDLAPPPLTVPATGVTPSTRPRLAMDPLGILHIVWNASDGVRYVTLDTKFDSSTYRQFSVERLLMQNEDDMAIDAVDIIAPTGGRAMVTVSMVPADDFCFAVTPEAGTVRLIDVDATTATSSAVVLGASSMNARIAALAGGTAAVVYEVDGLCDEVVNNQEGFNAYLDLVPLP